MTARLVARCLGAIDDEPCGWTRLLEDQDELSDWAYRRLMQLATAHVTSTRHDMQIMREDENDG